MQRLEVSGAVRLTYKSLGVKGLRNYPTIYVEVFRKTMKILVRSGLCTESNMGRSLYVRLELSSIRQQLSPSVSVACYLPYFSL